MCRNVTYAPGKRPTFTATARTWDLNNSPVKIRFTIHRATDNTTIATYTSSAVPSGYTATTTATADLPDGTYYVKAQSEPVYTDIPDPSTYRSAYSTAVNFTIDTAPVTAPTIWSTTHPTRATFTSDRPGAINITTPTAGTLGYYYTWTSQFPSNTNQCTDPHSTNSASGFALANSGTATLQIPAKPIVADNATVTIKIKTVGRTGALSAEKSYTLNVNPTGTTVTSNEAEAMLKSYAGGATGAVTTDPLASGGSKLTVTSPAGGSTTFKFTPTNTTKTIQPDLTIPTGKTVTFAVNNTPLQIANPNHADPQQPFTCTPATATGTGTLSHPTAELTTCNTESGSASATAPGTENTFTITTPTATTYTIDQIRLIDQSS